MSGDLPLRAATARNHEPRHAIHACYYAWATASHFANQSRKCASLGCSLYDRAQLPCKMASTNPGLSAARLEHNGQVNNKPVHAGLQSAHGFTMRPAHRKHVLCPLAHVIASSPSSRIVSMHTGQGSAGAAIWPVHASAPPAPPHRV